MLTVKDLKEFLEDYPEDMRVISESGKDFVHIINNQNSDLLLSTSKPIGNCKKCGDYAYDEIHQGLEDYNGYCPTCDENLFGFEIIKKENE